MEAQEETRERFAHLAKPDATEWQKFRLPARRRLSAACKHLLDNGTLQRADIMELGEVSQPQASLDIKAILDRAPGLMEYDKVGRCYRLNSSSQG